MIVDYRRVLLKSVRCEKDSKVFKICNFTVLQLLPPFALVKKQNSVNICALCCSPTAEQNTNTQNIL